MQPATPDRPGQTPRLLRLLRSGYEEPVSGQQSSMGKKLFIVNKSDMWHGHGHDDETRLMMCSSIRPRLTDLGSHWHLKKESLWVDGRMGG